MKLFTTCALIIVCLSLLVGCAGSSSISYQNLIEIRTGLNFDYGALAKLVIVDGPKSKTEQALLKLSQNQYMDLDVRAADTSGNLYILPDNMQPVWTLITTLMPGAAELGPLSSARYPIRMIDASSTRPVEAQAIRLQLKSADIQGTLALAVYIKIQTNNGDKILRGMVEIEVIDSALERHSVMGRDPTQRM
ncbi:hypothetical protein KAR48_05800 [bacterium]|nr:hypothetical protein [bacterium]